MKVNMKHIGEWAFRIGAVTVSIMCIIKGNGVGAIWPIIALVFHLIVCKFEKLCNELIEANYDNAKTIDEIVTANHDIAEALKKEVAKNAELQEEIIKLKQ